MLGWLLVSTVHIGCGSRSLGDGGTGEVGAEGSAGTDAAGAEPISDAGAAMDAPDADAQTISDAAAADAAAASDAQTITDAGAADGAIAPSFTEWRLPFDNAVPAQIAGAPGVVYYADFMLAAIGRLDLASGRVTQWFPRFTPSSPGDIKFRSSDATLFITSAPANGVSEIGQFDPASRVYKHWQMPPGLLGAPQNLALDPAGRVVFAAMTEGGSSYVIGRLDPATNVFTTWPIPDSIVPTESYAGKVTIAPDGTVFFNVDGFTNHAVARLELSGGAFTMWTFPGEVVFAIAADASGDVFFQWQSPESGIARLVPGSGRLTQWTTPHGQNDDFVLQGGRVFFGTVDPAGLAPAAVSALDPSQTGLEGALTPVAAGPVTPSSIAVQPRVDEGVAFEEGDAQVASSSVTGTVMGAFTEWSAQAGPRYFSGGTGTEVTFSEGSAPIIGRLVP
jgi:streptogramin lyase